MNTKLAIELLTQSHNDLTTFLTGLGLLNNETAIAYLKIAFDAAFQNFLDDYEDLQQKVAVTSSQIETIEESLTLADDYYRVEEERLQRLLADKAALVREIEIFKEQKESIEKFSDEEKLVIEAKVDEIKQDIFDTEEEIAKRKQEISDKQILINTYHSQIHGLRQQEAHHNSLAAKYDQESKVWGVVGTGRSGRKKYGWTTDPNKIALRDQEYAKAAALDKQADNLAANISVLNKEIKDTKLFIPILEQELIAHVLRLDTQKDLLSLSGLDTAQKLESVKLQIQQQTEDLERLTNQEIIEQETIVNNANQKLFDLQTQLEELQATETLAETALTDFETINAYLLAEDVTEFLDWTIDEDTPEVVKLWQQYLAVEGEEIISERLTSLQSQAASEDAVTVALETDSIEGYVILGAELAAEIENLSAIWLENLQESHQLTVDVWNLSEKRTEAVNELETYIEDNLAGPQGDYLLDKIQLQEAIARQEAQVNYADALGESVDSLEEAIAVLNSQKQQVNLLSEKIDHISTLTRLEKEYATLGSQASESLRYDLIEILNEEIDLTQQDLVIEIDLYNNQQEQWLETNLQNYIEQKQNHTLSSIKVSIDEVKDKIYGLETFGVAKQTYRGTFTVGDGGWTGNDKYPRYLADVNGDGHADLVGFAHHGVYVALAKGDGTFGVAKQAYRGTFTVGDGGWTGNDKYPRYLADVNGDGHADLVGFAHHGVYVALNNVANRQQQEIKSSRKTNQEQAISSLQNLRVETAYLTLQAEQNPDKLQNYLQAYLASDQTEASLNQLRNQYYPALSDATTLYNLQQEITDELTNSQQELETLKAQIAQKQANATAALSQADWYEEQAAIHWDLSRKAGPTWTEYRTSRGRCGSETVAVTHVDHHWVIWDSYTKQTTNLRKHAANLDEQIIEDTQQQNLTDQLIAQWQQANVAADEAELTLDQFITELELLEAQRQLLPEQEAQLETFSQLLPTLKEQLAIAQLAAEDAKTNTATEQGEYDSSSQAYQTALNDVLEEKATLDTNTQNLLQQIANTRAWVEQQTLSLDTELSETIALQLQLQSELDEIPPTPLTKGGDVSTLDNGGYEEVTEGPPLDKGGLRGDQTKTIQLQQSIDLLSQKQIILTAQQTALTQKITLLDAQKTVVETEHQLLLSTIDSPDSDYSNLEEQLLDAQKALSQVQELAQQAEATSIALTASMEDLQAFLEVQNDQYLTEIQSKQSTLQQLLDATELKENYTLLGIEKQLELNTLETQLQTRLIEATEAGSIEAAYLLTVAQQNNFATAAEIYYRDYRDLMTDTGGGCAGGIARPDDAVKADYYYNEMLKYRALQEQAQQQADQFAIVKEAAEDQIDLIQQQQAIAQTEFNDIQSSISNTQEDIETLQQQLNIAELRIDALEYLRNWTEQTLVQLLQVEQLNLAQATLEQEFATQRQLGIDETINAKFEKQQADIARDRAIATAKIEQLNQLQAEDALQQALNDLRTDLGLQPIEDIIQQAEYKGQLAGILSELETIQSQPELPENIQTILAETTADIHDALQGKEAQTIQENLLNSANALIGEANELQTEIAKLDAEEERLLGILEDSQTDLQGATKALYDEIIISQELGEETDDINQEYLEVLYKIGYAEGAVDLSSELAQQSKDILNQIIEGRIEERKARKKAFVNELLGTVTLVVSVVAAVATAGASLAGSGTLLGVSGTTLSTVATTLRTIGASLSAVQSAYNGDIKGAIFNAGMAALGAAELAKIPVPDLGLGLEHIENFGQVQQIANGVYNGYQAFEAGDGLTGFLSLTNAAFSLGLPEYSYLSQAALSINSGVQLAEEDEWLAATANFLNAGFLLGSNLFKTFGEEFAVSEQLLDILSTVEFAVNITDGIKTISDDGSLEGWLKGIQGIANGLVNYNDQQTNIDELTDFKKELLLQNILKQPDITDEEIQHLLSEYELEDIFIRQEYNGQEAIYIMEEFKLNENNQGALITRGEIEANKATILITFGWLNNVSPEWNFLVAELLEAKYPNHNIIIGDWSELAQDVNYFSAAFDTKLAGQAMAKQLNDLEIDFSQLQIIGHSLGAQVAGAIGEYAKENYTELNTIIGLDPASPGFERNTLTFLPYSSDEGRLDKTDAKNVTLIRSDYDWIFSLGYRNPLGSEDIKLTSEMLDYYPGNDHSDAVSFLIDALGDGSSLDNLDQFYQKINKQLQPQPTAQSSYQVLSNIKNNFNENSQTIELVNHPFPSFLASSGSSFGSYQTETNNIVPLDPIIIDLDGNGLELSELSTSSVFFDIDADVYAENTAWTTDGILTLDLNNDGTINNITEVFSEYFNDASPNSGLDALASLDSNQNGIISATDTQFNQILVWQDINQDGISQPNELKTLNDHGITSINLNGITEDVILTGNVIRQSSIFNRNDGTSGQISDVAFLVTQTGFKVNQTESGIEILAEDDTAVSLLIHEDTTDLTLNLADNNLQVAIGNIGNDYLYTTVNNDIFLSGEAGDDTLVGSDGNDWLVGDEGSDRLQGNPGDDLLYIDADDTFIDGGEGTDIAIVTTTEAVTLDLGTANLEMAIGNDGDDTFTHSGDETVVMDGGNGNDKLTGGTNDDVLNGGDGNDIITGGLGGDILTGGNDADIFLYNSFNDSSTANPDNITDFEQGSDRLNFSNLPINSFDDLTITQDNGNTTISVNDQDFVINLNNEIQLTPEDFIFDESLVLNINGNIVNNTLERYGDASLLNGNLLPQDTDDAVVTYFDNGNEVKLENNAWKYFDLESYNVTENTHLSFQFRSQEKAEIQGFGFDKDDDLFNDPNTFFKLYGTQNWGNQAFNDYQGLDDPEAVDGWKDYNINLGQYFTGQYDHLVFFNDNDTIDNLGGEAQFRNIVLS
ncbi:MAG: FG-GAP-like repeat-containing protein [Crocosphaera sp.]